MAVITITHPEIEGSSVEIDDVSLPEYEAVGWVKQPAKKPPTKKEAS